ncbi:MAG: DUF3047 domain-containing protein [Devosiaceae bacterium]|nr:DUF3047 domain-containing protein [Devosiaceae bacterium MH13]
MPRDFKPRKSTPQQFAPQDTQAENTFNRRQLLKGTAAGAVTVGIASAVGSLALGPTPAHASTTLSFNGWQSWTFNGIPATRFAPSGSSLSLTAEGSSSVLYGVVPTAARRAASASWQWQVSQGVGPTDLARRGGDDRALALYFVFVSAETAARFGDQTPALSRLLGMRDGRTLIYVWGGNAGRGTILNSPYLRSRGKTVVLRPAGTGGWTSERVDLASDYSRAFGGGKDTLIAVAVSSDSDDTSGVNQAAIRNITLA